MNRLLQILSGRRVAIVGNGPVRENKSAEIDASDVVVRFNHFYNYDTGHVGRKVSVVMQTIAKAWFETKENRHIDVIRQQRPSIFLVKCPNNYISTVHGIYGTDTRIDALTRIFTPWVKYTTGTAVLCYLADHLESAAVKVYGFQDEDGWNDYLRGNASQYADTGDEERRVMLAAISKLEAKRIISDVVTIPRRIVIPTKLVSSGLPGKNRMLIKPCVEECQKVGIPITVIGDDSELLYDVHSTYGVDICALPSIGTYSDVTESLRQWRAIRGYCGYVALVQCTSPNLKGAWIVQCLDEQKNAAITATATTVPFKANAIFREENGIFIPNSSQLPPASAPRQILPKTVRITGAVESFHSDAIDFASFWQAGVMKPVMVSETDSVDVDVAEDLASVSFTDGQMV